MPVSPWLRVAYNQSMVNVDHEPAALPRDQSAVFPCESDSLHYEIFHFYLPQRDFSEDSFFNAIRLLRTVKGAQEFGREVSANRHVSLLETSALKIILFLDQMFLRFGRLVSRQRRVRYSVCIRESVESLQSP